MESQKWPITIGSPANSSIYCDLYYDLRCCELVVLYYSKRISRREER